MTLKVVVADNENKLPNKEYIIIVKEADAIIVKDRCNICSYEEYDAAWNRICDALQNQHGAWNDFPEGYFYSIIVQETGYIIY